MSRELDFTRLRHLRDTEELRRRNAETSLSATEFIYPMFVTLGTGIERPIDAMPGQAQMSVDVAVAKTESALAAGIDKVLLFGLPQHKDAVGSSSSWATSPTSPSSWSF